jgi:hypothetical protein
MENFCRVRQATDDNKITVHVHCMLDDLGYRHTLRIRNTYCFSFDTMVHGDAWALSYAYIACHVILSLSTADCSIECKHPPAQPLTGAVFGETIKET